MDHGLTFTGKPLDEYSTEELIEAVESLRRMTSALVHEVEDLRTPEPRAQQSDPSVAWAWVVVAVLAFVLGRVW